MKRILSPGLRTRRGGRGAARAPISKTSPSSSKGCAQRPARDSQPFVDPADPSAKVHGAPQKSLPRAGSGRSPTSVTGSPIASRIVRAFAIIRRKFSNAAIREHAATQRAKCCGPARKSLSRGLPLRDRRDTRPAGCPAEGKAAEISKTNVVRFRLSQYKLVAEIKFPSGNFTRVIIPCGFPDRPFCVPS